MRNTIMAFLNSSAGEHDRNRSWEHCFRYFNNAAPRVLIADRDQAALQLAFYLASWGMYRGSSFLIEYTYTVHGDVVDVITDRRFEPLWGSDFGSRPADEDRIDLVVDLVEAVRDALRPFARDVGKGKPSDILVTKILLGTVGCLPACDRYFEVGFRAEGHKFSRCNRLFVERAFGVCQSNVDELIEIQVELYRERDVRFPLMKLIDMYFWQLGFEAEAKSP